MINCSLLASNESTSNDLHNQLSITGLIRYLRLSEEPLFDAALNKLRCKPSGMNSEWLPSGQWMWIRTNSCHGYGWAAFVSTGLLWMLALLSGISFQFPSPPPAVFFFPPPLRQMSCEGQCTHCVTARDTPIVRAETKPNPDPNPSPNPNPKPAMRHSAFSLSALVIVLISLMAGTVSSRWLQKPRTSCSCHKGPFAAHDNSIPPPSPKRIKIPYTKRNKRDMLICRPLSCCLHKSLV